MKSSRGCLTLCIRVNEDGPTPEQHPQSYTYLHYIASLALWSHNTIRLTRLFMV
jgi:hypothetical protein